ncbi:3',5'-cyclic-AMP phosphodiesterase [Serratia microhaemolytica]|uniref:3',5'-cyclic-AMP phosphodiesterase n=1 Tax=Serratia microhaemolytica TaxID=2675110 RepID=UPI000FDE24B2|nr:3',5'-cyclic-AMP phosphodiesterase [Serratia microhaemolytica]
MESQLTLSVAGKSAAKILQITDTHLFASTEQTLLGIPTYASYHAVLDAVIAQQQHYDLIVATGDLAQDHTLQAYHHFAAGIARLSAPCVWLPGNHDFQPAMIAALAQAGVSCAKQVLLGEDWQILLLDSQVCGVAHGELSVQQLAWLRQCLQAHPTRYTLLLLHHHPLASGCDWLDQHRLRNAQQLLAVLVNYPQANTLLCGHIHQALDVDWHGRRVLASPSTCVQFKPHCTNFTVDDTAPGWRYLELLPDGGVASQLCRLEQHHFRPDINSDGY